MINLLNLEDGNWIEKANKFYLHLKNEMQGNSGLIKKIKLHLEDESELLSLLFVTLYLKLLEFFACTFFLECLCTLSVFTSNATH